MVGKANPCILDICVWKDNRLSIQEQKAKCAECFKRNDMNQQDIGWCQHFYNYYVVRE